MGPEVVKAMIGDTVIGYVAIVQITRAMYNHSREDTDENDEEIVPDE